MVMVFAMVEMQNDSFEAVVEKEQALLEKHSGWLLVVSQPD